MHVFHHPPPPSRSPRPHPTTTRHHPPHTHTHRMREIEGGAVYTCTSVCYQCGNGPLPSKRQTDRQTDRQRDRWTDGQMDRDRDRERQRQTETEKQRERLYTQVHQCVINAEMDRFPVSEGKKTLLLLLR